MWPEYKQTRRSRDRPRVAMLVCYKVKENSVGKGRKELNSGEIMVGTCIEKQAGKGKEMIEGHGRAGLVNVPAG